MSNVRRKPLSETDRTEWARYVQGVAPLPGRDRPPPPSDPPMSGRTPSPQAVLPNKSAVKANAGPVSVGYQPGGLDNSTWNRFRTGRLGVQRTLDLHGRTAQRAHHALESFLFAAHADGVRCVEIITGRGSGESGGVIRREFPMWLNLPNLRPLVLAASHPHSANSGSVRLLLRRTR